MFLLMLACASEVSDVAEAPPQPPPLVDEAPEPPPRPTEELLIELEDPELAPAAIAELVERGASQELERVALESQDLGARGWAIQALVKLQTGQEALATIQTDERNPELVRVWAAAGRIALADRQTLEELRPLAQRWPELERPIRMREAAL